MKILSVENLSRSFGGIKANDNISFEVEQGTVLGVIGPNGAGKSTLFDLITGYTKADSGKIKFFNKNIFGLSPDKISNFGSIAIALAISNLFLCPVDNSFAK